VESVVSSIPWAETCSEISKSDTGKGDDLWLNVLLPCMFDGEPLDVYDAFLELLFLALYFIAVLLGMRHGWIDWTMDLG